ncbi:hypothetical protein [Chitinophaga barathri]|uniref:ZU5 domain-containing protein n=1 Tax=Chitinophaga barathri TaxID=1647451 RepID=A0A3N4MHZ4_9BACT|nr:hypothetical protein [Chitinophaga barathri]RPD39700.1 hypothetical protein EG028_18845 [Chitinophaga barathri]
MKRITLLIALFGILLTACDKNDAAPEKPALPEGKVTQPGVADGSPVAQKVIGAAGGDLTSNDGTVKVTIPAGALSGDQTMSIQRISNTNPLGTASGYRIMPHGVTFSKPVSITFNYTDHHLRGTVPEALGIAYQDGKGVWMSISARTLNKTGKTVTVNTTHFSDWSFFKCFELVASATSLPVSRTSELTVYADLFLINAEHDEIPIGERSGNVNSYIKEWSLVGAGRLVAAGPEGTYTAPATVPAAPNPVAVEVRLDWGAKGVYLLVAHIEIYDLSIEVRVNGGAWIKFAASPSVRMGDQYMISNSDGDERGQYVALSWVGGLGNHGYNIFDGGHNNAQYLIDGGNSYGCFYVDENDNLIMSPGGITVTSLGEQDGLVKGTFMMDPSGYGVGHKATAKIEGRFVVAKSW